jgi:major membrane immunogen (membrane-anchored lipoprotein)
MPILVSKICGEADDLRQTADALVPVCWQHAERVATVAGVSVSSLETVWNQLHLSYAWLLRLFTKHYHWPN